MKDLFDAISTRVKEPYWGYFLLSFLAFNWRGFFLLLFATGTAQERIALFDFQTSIWTLIICPIIVALSIVIVTPWLNVIFGKISRIAYETLNSLDIQREHKYLLEKIKLEKTRTLALADKENDLINKAKRDEDIKKIEDEELRESLKREIDQLRVKRNTLAHDKDHLEINNGKKLSEFQKVLLNEISKSKDGCIQKKFINGYKFIKVDNKQISESNAAPEYLRYADAISLLVKQGLLKDLDNAGQVFELTVKGRNFVEPMGYSNNDALPLQPTE